MKKVLVIGGGPAGLTAAIAAALAGAEVSLWEASDRCGRKLDVAGNGRCNVWYRSIDKSAYHGSCPEAVTTLVREHEEDVFAFFRKCGIATTLIGDGWYPLSEEGISVYQNLMYAIEELPVTLHHHTTIRDIRFADDQWYIASDEFSCQGDALILATGSLAGTDRSEEIGQELSSRLHHRVRPMVPALCGLIGSDRPYSWGGIRVRGSVGLHVNGSLVASSSGQIQLTGEGISGIPVFDIAGEASRALEAGCDVCCTIDFCPSYTKEELAAFIAERRTHASMGHPLTGILPAKLRKVLKQDGLLEDASIIKAFPVRIAASRDKSMAQVMAGGVDLTDIDLSAMASRLHPNLYFCGEMLDVDGICGGYNLAFAFVSGLIAGKHAARSPIA